MASDSQQFNRANAARERLIEGECFSDPDEPGTITGILVPYTEGDRHRLRTDTWPYVEYDANEVAKGVVKNGRIPKLFYRAGVEDFQEVVSDREISSVIVCGLGNFGAVQICQPNDPQLEQLPAGSREDGYIRGFDLAHMTTHLKLGGFVHRVSCRRPLDLNFPLGWGVVSDHRNIWAPNGKGVTLNGLDSPDNKYIRPITDREYLGYAALKELFPLQGIERNHHGLFDLLSNDHYMRLQKFVRPIIDTVRFNRSNENEGIIQP